MGLFYKLFTRIIFIAIASLVSYGAIDAQGLLNKMVSINANKQPLADVLVNIGKQGNFYFSYNSDIVPQGKTITLSANNRTVKQVLDIMFDGKYQYKERDNYIIIQDGEGYTVSGYVVDRTTGSKISYASVYERQQLASTITNEQGYFKLKLKDKGKYATASIAVSKGMYADTFMTLKPGFDQQLTVSITPKDYELEPIVVKPQVEKNWLAGIFLSSRQRFQALNIGGLIASRPVQTSFVPGLGTHGKLGAQVVNKFSLNVLGGYTAGAKGVEIGGLFNIDKGDVGYVQLSGLFNVVGGDVRGVEVGGLYNGVLDSVNGIQASGLSGMIKGSMKGVQISGLYSRVGGHTKGIQVAGLVNVTPDTMKGLQIAGWGSVSKAKMKGMQLGGLFNKTKKMKGVQMAGVGNISNNETQGLQLSSIFNYAGKLNGTQIGLLNMADSSDGYSIGFVNVVLKNGYHKISLSTNEVLNTTLSFKTGTKKLYSILTAGMNIEKNGKAYGFGYGMGKEFFLSKRFSLNTDITANLLYLGDWSQTPTQICLAPELHFKLNKYLSLCAGPTVSLCYSNSNTNVAGYKSVVPGYDTYNVATNFTAWVGWHAGVDIF